MPLSLKVYSYSKCSTCRKALKWLENNSINYEVIDIINEPPSREIISEAISQVGTSKKLFNTSGLSYRNLGAKAVNSMTEEEKLNHLIKDGRLIKRPLLISSKGGILVGFKMEEWVDLLLNDRN